MKWNPLTLEANMFVNSWSRRLDSFEATFKRIVDFESRAPLSNRRIFRRYSEARQRAIEYGNWWRDVARREFNWELSLPDSPVAEHATYCLDREERATALNTALQAYGVRLNSLLLDSPCFGSASFQTEDTCVFDYAECTRTRRLFVSDTKVTWNRHHLVHARVRKLTSPAVRLPRHLRETVDRMPSRVRREARVVTGMLVQMDSEVKQETQVPNGLGRSVRFLRDHKKEVAQAAAAIGLTAFGTVAAKTLVAALSDPALCIGNIVVGAYLEEEV